MTTTTVWGYPYVSSNEADVYSTINEFVTMTEARDTPVEEVGLNTPPSSGLAPGDAYIVGTSPTGAWAGRANCKAYYSAGGWRFLPGEDSAGTPITMGAAHDGWRVFNKDDGQWYEWNGSAWTATGSGP